MITTGQEPEHRMGLRQIGRFPEHVMIQLNHRIAPQHDRLRLLPRDRPGLALREGLHLLDRGPTWHQPLLEGWAFDVEWDAQQGEQLVAARRGGSQNEWHLADCGKTIWARQNFTGPHVCDNR